MGAAWWQVRSPFPYRTRSETVVCIASGPSLTAADVAECGRRGWDRIACNTSWRLGSEVVYAGDGQWWDEYWPEVQPAVEAGSLSAYTRDPDAARKYGIRYVHSRPLLGVSPTPGEITEGGNSGHQALHLARNFGARRIILLGYDFQRKSDGLSHWHGDHPGALNVALQPFVQWCRWMGQLAEGLAAEGVEVLNASRETALTCFPRVRLGDIRDR